MKTKIKLKFYEGALLASLIILGMLIPAEIWMGYKIHPSHYVNAVCSCCWVYIGWQLIRPALKDIRKLYNELKKEKNYENET